VFQKQEGDFDVTARVESLTAPQLYSRAGLMARQDLSADSRHVFFLVFPDNRPRHANTSAYEFQYREAKGGISKGIYPPQATCPPAFPVDFPNAWLRLKRVGNEFTGYVSTDGKNWKACGSHLLDLPQTVFLGLAATSHDAEASPTAKFTDLASSGHPPITSSPSP
jgi:regulation of enolase protein 1 (concanavalin A-like superfamily)